MAQEAADIGNARRIELAIGQLDSLSTLPCVALQVFFELLRPQFSSVALADVIESDPALCAKFLSLLYQHHVDLVDEQFSLHRALDRLSPQLLRDTALSVRVNGLSELELVPGDTTTMTRKGLLLHSLAVAFCARELAEITSSRIDAQLAYLAGLLHDIGKLALEQVMPRSFALIAEEAESLKSSFCIVEQGHLGVDHSILGKNLARRWHLPEAVTMAIWLHHSDSAIIAQMVSEARIARLVQSADAMARQSGIGLSGSFDTPDSTEQIAQTLQIDVEQLEQIQQKLPEKVQERSRILGLHLPNTATRYCRTAHKVAEDFARKHTAVYLQNQKLQSASSHLDFLTDFLLNIDASTAAIDIAEDFAVRWQRFYQTGAVCLYFAGLDSQHSVEAVVVESLGQSTRVIFDIPEDSAPIPKPIARSFAVVNAHDYVDWLFEQLEVDFDVGRSKLMPLLSGGRAVGVIVFELHYPADAELFGEKFRISTSIAGAVLDNALSRRRQERLAEQFAQLISRTSSTPSRSVTDSSFDALAEMAAGVAHELNNPLSVISGRAQLLAKVETDQDKAQRLEQIQENVDEVSAIIEDLMSFAQPLPPRSTLTDIRQIIDEAVQLASQKTGTTDVNFQIDVAADVTNVFVDSAQIASALANIISNSIESYSDEVGPVNITVCSETGDSVRLRITDLGCGMDAETLRRVTYPFFSAKPAGRKRGMGLAYAQRFVRLNKGSLQITSEAGNGTTVTIRLPSRQIS